MKVLYIWSQYFWNLIKKVCSIVFIGATTNLQWSPDMRGFLEISAAAKNKSNSSQNSYFKCLSYIFAVWFFFRSKWADAEEGWKDKHSQAISRWRSKAPRTQILKGMLLCRQSWRMLSDDLSEPVTPLLQCLIHQFPAQQSWIHTHSQMP